MGVAARSEVKRRNSPLGVMGVSGAERCRWFAGHAVSCSIRVPVRGSRSQRRLEGQRPSGAMSGPAPPRLGRELLAHEGEASVDLFAQLAVRVDATDVPQDFR